MHFFSQLEIQWKQVGDPFWVLTLSLGNLGKFGQRGKKQFTISHFLLTNHSDV